MLFVRAFRLIILGKYLVIISYYNTIIYLNKYMILVNILLNYKFIFCISTRKVFYYLTIQIDYMAKNSF